jgi:hypothetical protein
MTGMTVRSRLAVAFLLTTSMTGAAAGDNVIVFTQVPCQFLEPENGRNHGFEATSKAECEQINARTAAERLAATRPIKLRPGRYIFRVTNRNVPYELGFWLRGAGTLDRLSLPSVAGKGLTTGTTKDFEILLEEGEYLYSSPRNPTPDYRLVVRQRSGITRE